MGWRVSPLNGGPFFSLLVESGFRLRDPTPVLGFCFGPKVPMKLITGNVSSSGRGSEVWVVLGQAVQSYPATQQ